MYGVALILLIVCCVVPSEYTTVHGPVPVRFRVSVAVPPKHIFPSPATVAVASGLMVSINVATESQPVCVVSVTEYVPAWL